MDFKNKTKAKSVSNTTSFSSEAYTQVYLANCYDHWVAEADDATTDPDTRKTNRMNYPKKRWTANQQASSKFGGWDEEGVLFYNTLQHKVKAERKTERSKKLELEYMAHAKIMFGKKIRMRKNKETQIEEIEIVVLDTDDEDEEDDNSQHHDENKRSYEKDDKEVLSIEGSSGEENDDDSIDE